MMTHRSSTSQPPTRRLPIGAEVRPAGGAHFRVWAPRRRNIAIEFSDSPSGPTPTGRLILDPEGDGYFSGFSPHASAGTRYAFRLDDEVKLYPDPASRWQPEGVHGPSELVDPAAFAWNDAAWNGPTLRGQVLYELHLGTFTPQGTWSAAAREIPRLKELGVTLVEVMPIAEFPGEFGWGYDGVDLFAPRRLYGPPDDVRRFVDEAHCRGVGVILDVVYNHFGPVGNYLGQFSADYVSRKHHTDWGEALNFDGPNCGPVREFVVANAGYWIEEFHFDGLRLDAVHAIVDDSADHILAAVVRRVREAAGRRSTLVFAENEFQQAWLMRPSDQGGYGLDAGWNDDFHHVARVAATGHAEHYYADYRGTPQELISAVKWGHLYQGQFNSRQGRRRGSPALDLEAPRFVNFLQNHDQVGNSAQGRRLHELTSPGRHRALTALWALAPQTPLLFQGQEFSAPSPFHFFADHEPELGKLIRKGREDFMRKFLRLAGHDAVDHFSDPGDRRTFERSKLDPGQRERNRAAYDLHRDLLRLRREDAVFSSQRAERIHGSVIAKEAFLLRYFGRQGDDRLLVINLGRDFQWRPMTEPLAAPPAQRDWRLLWSSENPKYGGSGTPALDPEHWSLPGHAALVLRAAPTQ
jgi:maltooligosyltrehalose trehalohydrolase